MTKGKITPIDFSKFYLHQKVGFQISYELGSSTLVEYDLTMTQGSSTNSEQGLQTPFGPVSGSVSTFSTPTLDTSVQDQFLLKGGFQTGARSSEGY